MWAEAEDVTWLTSRLNDSSAAETKLFYLRSFPSDGTAFSTVEDPMGLTEHSNWTLSTLLTATRLIACDERTLWMHMGPRILATFASRLDGWNEQQAVKLAHYFLDECAKGARGASLAAELAVYAHANLRPQTRERVAGAVAEFASRPTVTATATQEEPQEVTGAVIVVPMAADDAYSEGSLVCRASVPAFGELLRVPRAQMFFRDTVITHCALGRVLSKDKRCLALFENEEALLVLCFVYEYFAVGIEHSNWGQTLLRHCPVAYPTVPAFWSSGDLAELAGMDMIDEVVAQREQTASFVSDLRPALPMLFEGLQRDAENAAMDSSRATNRMRTTAPVNDLAAFEALFTIDNITFAKATFDSRAFNLHVDGRDVLSLVPWADMINHANRSDVLVRRVEENGGDFVMYAGAALTDEADIGRELWMSYGPLQNWELLQYYGFVLPENEHDQMPFPFIPDTSAGEGEGTEQEEARAWAARRNALVDRYHLLCGGRCWVSRRGIPCPALLALLRVHLASATEFSLMEAQSPFSPLSAETEAQLLAVMAATADGVLDLFPTTLEEDHELLADLDPESMRADETANGNGARECASSEGAEGAEDDDHAMDNYRLSLRVRMSIKETAQRLHAWCAAEQARLNV